MADASGVLLIQINACQAIDVPRFRTNDPLFFDLASEPAKRGIREHRLRAVCRIVECWHWFDHGNVGWFCKAYTAKVRSDFRRSSLISDAADCMPVRFQSSTAQSPLGVTACVAGVLLSLVGCQAFRPFQTSVREKSAALRDWTNGGIEALQNGKLNQARSLFSKACHHAPEDQRSRAHLARTEVRMGNLPEAIGHMQTAVAMAPGDAALNVELGEMYLESGQWSAARQQADRALRINPQLATAWALSGKTWHRKNEYAKALADYQRALGYDPRLHSVQMLAVEIYLAMGRPTRALSTIEQLLSDYPPDRQPESALVAKAIALMELKQTGSAVNVLTEVCRRDDASAEAFVRLSQAQLERGQFEQAQLTLNRARQKYPETTTVVELIETLQAHDSVVAAAEEDAPADQLLLR